MLCLSIILGNEVAQAFVNLGDHEISVFENGEEGEEKENPEEELKKEFLDRNSFYQVEGEELRTANFSSSMNKYLIPFLEINNPPPEIFLNS